MTFIPNSRNNSMRDFMNWFEGYMDAGGTDLEHVFKMAKTYSEKTEKPTTVYRGVNLPDDQSYPR